MMKTISSLLTLLFTVLINTPGFTQVHGGTDTSILGPDTSICKGECVFLSAVGSMTNPFSTFEWSTGDTLPSITVCPEKTDTVSVAIYDPGNDTTFDTIIIFVSGIPSGPAPFKEAEVCEDSCMVLEGPEGGQSYSWYPEEGLDDPHKQSPEVCPEFTKNVYVVTVYTDTTTDCPYKDTITVWLVECIDSTITEDTSTNDTTIINNVNSHSYQIVEIYPNPVQSHLYIKTNKVFNDNPPVYITDYTGRIVERFYFKPDFLSSVNVSGYSPGIYFITFESAEDRIIYKFIVEVD